MAAAAVDTAADGANMRARAGCPAHVRRDVLTLARGRMRVVLAEDLRAGARPCADAAHVHHARDAAEHARHRKTGSGGYDDVSGVSKVDAERQDERGQCRNR